MRIIQNGYTCRYGEYMAVVHESAPGPYRKAEFHKNWFVIGRSHGYFVIKATEHTDKTRKEREEIARQSAEPRMKTFQARLDSHLITQEEYNECTEALWNGVEQGITGAENQERQLDNKIRLKKSAIKKYKKPILSGHQKFLHVLRINERKHV